MRTIILCGNSVAVSSLGACLRGREGLRVLPIATGTLSEAHWREEPQPDVVIFDLTAPPPSLGEELLRAKPGLLLVGVDLANGKALVLSSQTSRVLTTDDLVELIESHADTADVEGLSQTAASAADQMDAEKDDGVTGSVSPAPEKTGS